MRTYRYPDAETARNICERPLIDEAEILPRVSRIIDDIARRGDEGVLDYTSRFDHVTLSELRVAAEEMEEAVDLLPVALKQAIQRAQENIVRFHKVQICEERKVQTSEGVVCWRVPRPIEKVGLYIPAGSAPLFSTLLMLAIPARIAGCREIVLCSPPTPLGKLDPVMLYAAKSLGITAIFKIGGAQAVAAMAIGTESIPRVFKICGPGNQYVSAAKRIVRDRGLAEIDCIAGPSEVLIIADESSPPSWVAADLLAVAEHGPDSQTVLVTNSEGYADAVIRETMARLKKLPRETITSESVSKSFAVVTRSVEEAVEFSNAYGPEHLILALDGAEAFLPLVQNAGSVFLGPFSPEAAGDYASGTNHCLPTSGMARTSSGVSVDTFLKKISVQRLSRQGLLGLASTICTMAEAEGLMGHAEAVRSRFEKEAE